MVSLTVADAVAHTEWHLPTFDPRNENKYHYKLHSLDIYFWTQQDALQFINGVRRVLPPSQVEVLDEPGPPPQLAGSSSVVQKLESMAISDPQYSSPIPGPPPGPPSFAPPPTSAPPDTTPASFVPMAYNPAAPAAPETVRHREKTPPPDEDPLNPLAVAVAYDYHKQPFTPGIPPPSQFPPGGLTSPGLPPHGLASPGLPPSLGSPGIAPPHFGAPAPHPGVQRAQTMPVHGALGSPGLASPYGSAFPGSPGLPPPPQQQFHPQAPHAQPTPPVTSPGLPPPGAAGYPNYGYGQQLGAQDYSIHQQAYRPTAVDSTPKPYQYQPKQDGKGKLEENAGRLERGMTGMFKKFEKKFG